MDDAALLRYSRQILLPQLGYDGQERLAAARVLVLGLGGLGSAVALYLAAAGVGQLLLVDDDRVDRTNLQRQIAHTEADVGRLKVDSATARLRALNPLVNVEPLAQRLDGAALDALAGQVDVLVDGCDNFATRFAVNAASLARGTPLVSGSAIRWQGQVCVFRPGTPDAPCYHCLYPDTEEVAEACAHTGVLAPLVGVIGAVQALQTLKLLAGLDAPGGRLLSYDALQGRWRQARLRRDPACPACGGR